MSLVTQMNNCYNGSAVTISCIKPSFSVTDDVTKDLYTATGHLVVRVSIRVRQEGEDDDVCMLYV